MSPSPSKKTQPLDPSQWMGLSETRRVGERARRQVRRRGSAAVKDDGRMAAVEAALERSMAMNLALWELVAGKLDLAPKELTAKLEEIELRGAGAEPGEPEEAVACVACQRANRKSRLRCAFCGEFVAERSDPSFDISGDAE